MNEAEPTQDGCEFLAEEVDLGPEGEGETDTAETVNPEEEAGYTDWQKKFNQELDRLERQHFYYLYAAMAAADKAGDFHGNVSEAMHNEALAEELSNKATAEKAKEDRRKLIESVPVEHLRDAEAVREKRGLFMSDSRHNPENKEETS